jgi:hypothetical protein
MRITGVVLAIPMVLAVLTAPTPAATQDVQYETVTKLELPGALGTMMRAAARLGGGSTESVETTYIKGTRMRTDSDESSVIVDLDDGRVIFLDHAARTYQVMDLNAAVARAEQAASEARDGQAANDQEDATGRISFRFAVDRPNERQQVAGYAAERFFITMEAEGEFVPEDGEEMEEAGTLVVLTDLWASSDVPVAGALGEFEDVSARQFAEAGSSLAETFAAAFAEDPALRTAFEQSAAEASKIEGMAVRTVTTFVGVAPGHRFDRSLITEPRQESGARRGLGRLAARAAAAAVGQAAPTAEAAEPTQSVLMTVTSEVRNISTASLDAGLFQIPDGYTQVDF